MKKYERISKTQLEEAIASSINFSDVCRALGKRPVGGNITNIRFLAQRWNIDCTHMTGQAHARGKPSSKRLAASEILVCGTSSDRRTQPQQLTRALLECGVPYQCAGCGLTEWRNRALTLEVDHKDSRYWNNQQENLQFLCSNCHTQDTKERGRLA